MPIFRERILKIEAEQYHHPATAPEMVKFEDAEPGDAPWSGRAYVLTGVGSRLYLEPGDFIVTERGGKGHNVMKPELFEARFEEI